MKSGYVPIAIKLFVSMIVSLVFISFAHFVLPLPPLLASTAPIAATSTVLPHRMSAPRTTLSLAISPTVTSALTPIQIETGAMYGCVLHVEGSIDCWGSAVPGNGVENGGTYLLPTRMQGITDATALAAGERHLCAIVADGAVQCVGKNDVGQLGDGSQTDRTNFVLVQDLPAGAIELAAGRDHTCALLVSGAVYCWGSDLTEQDAAQTFVFHLTAMPVDGLEENVKAIAAGLRHTCALFTSGAVHCWGVNDQGQVGNGGTALEGVVPLTQAVGLDAGVSALALGYDRSCALMADGGLRCWGLNTPGRLGIGSDSVNVGTPTAVMGLAGPVTAVDVTYNHICAIIDTGAVQCWGFNDAMQLGDGTTDEQTTPTTVVGLPTPIAKIATGTAFTCAIGDNQAVYCWGTNDGMQLGQPEGIQLRPVTVTGIDQGAAAVAAGYFHSCAVVDGAVRCWGGNANGQLGDGSIIGRHVPVAVSTLTDVQDVGVGGTTTCALKDDNTLACWGNNFAGHLGIDSNVLSSTVPVAVDGINGIINAFDIGYSHSCAATDVGVQCWGSGLYGKLGNGTAVVSSTIPVAVSSINEPMRDVATGSVHTCAVSMAGGVQCWGLNDTGRLGVSGIASSTVPVDVPGVDNIVAIAADSSLSNGHTCALNAAGVVFCWGFNLHGELGDGTTTDAYGPVAVVGLAGPAQAIALGLGRSCALLTDGRIQCWGSNAFGKLGNGSVLSSLTPVLVVGLRGRVVDLALGTNHSCAVMDTGMVQCWGRDIESQLGDGANATLAQPVETLPPPTVIYLPAIQ